MNDWHERPLLVFDLECTCWADDHRTPKETIEIGAVVTDLRQPGGATYQAFVRPTDRPALSDFCRQLTHIRQADVEAAPGFVEALEAWWAWAAEQGPCIPASWGDFDRRQLLRECKRHGVPFPLESHLNLKTAAAKALGDRPRGMEQVLARLDLPLEGTHHRGLDDAKNIARIAERLMRDGADLRRWTHALG